MKKNKIEHETVTTRIYKTDKMYLSEMAEKHGKPEKDCFAEIVGFYKARHGEAAETVQTVQTVMDGAVSKMIKAFNELSGEIVGSIARFSSVNNSVIQNINVKSLDLPEKKTYYISKIREEMANNLNLWDIPHSERLEKLWGSVWNETPITDIKDWGTWYTKTQKTVEAQTLLKHKIEFYGVGRYGEEAYNRYITKFGGEKKVTNRLLESSNMFSETATIIKEIDVFVVEETEAAVKAEKARIEAERRAEEKRKAEATAKAEKDRIEAERRAEEKRKAEVAAEAEKERIEAERRAEEKRKADAAAEAEKAQIEAERRAEEKRLAEIREADRKREEREKKFAIAQKRYKEAEEALAGFDKFIEEELKLDTKKLRYLLVWRTNIKNASEPSAALRIQSRSIKNIVDWEGEKELYKLKRDKITEDFRNITS